MVIKNKRPLKNKDQTILVYFFLVSLFFFSFLFLYFFILAKNKENPKSTSKQIFPPANVRVSNINSQGLTVSWFTENETTSEILLSEERESFDKLNYKIRAFLPTQELSKPSQIHYFQIGGLLPDKIYYYIIRSGEGLFYKTLGGQWENYGLVEKLQTAPLFEKISPLIISGRVSDDQDLPVKQAVVFAEIPGKSNLLSCLSLEDGSWKIDLGLFLSFDLNSPLKPDPKVDLVRLTVAAPGRRESFNYSSLPNNTEASSFEPIDLKIGPSEN